MCVHVCIVGVMLEECLRLQYKVTASQIFWLYIYSMPCVHVVYLCACV